jgi:hypothetical protein
MQEELWRLIPAAIGALRHSATVFAIRFGRAGETNNGGFVKIGLSAIAFTERRCRKLKKAATRAGVKIHLSSAPIDDEEETELAS